MLLAQEDQAHVEHIVTTMDSLSSSTTVSRVRGFRFWVARSSFATI